MTSMRHLGGLVVLAALLVLACLMAVSIGPVDSSVPRALDALASAWTGRPQDGPRSW